MGRKAKLKKERKQNKTINQSNQQYDKTDFVKQFQQMGYQVQVDPKLQPKNNRGNIAPEIPQVNIEPKL